MDYFSVFLKVHIFTSRCNNDVAACVCAVAVKAGRDSFIIDKCDPSDSRMEMFDCLDNSIRIFEKGRDNYMVSCLDLEDLDFKI